MTENQHKKHQISAGLLQQGVQTSGSVKKTTLKKKKKSFQACFLKSQYDNVQLYSTGSLHVQVSVLCFACLLTIIVFPVLAASSTA